MPRGGSQGGEPALAYILRLLDYIQNLHPGLQQVVRQVGGDCALTVRSLCSSSLAFIVIGKFCGAYQLAALEGTG